MQDAIVMEPFDTDKQWGSVGVSFFQRFWLIVLLGRLTYWGRLLPFSL
jgi:hypothetical protein